MKQTDRVEGKDLLWLSNDQRAPSGGHKDHLIDVVGGVEFARDLKQTV